MPTLDWQTLKRHVLAVAQCTTREGLDRLTRVFWRTCDTPRNAAARSQWRARIEAQREIPDRNDRDDPGAVTLVGSWTAFERDGPEKEPRDGNQE